VKVFVAQVAKRVKEIDNREWSFKLQEQKNDMGIINAARDVAIAYAAQPRTTVPIMCMAGGKPLLKTLWVNSQSFIVKQ
jgi:hypothetical protein